jgi:hypothetical protein
MSKLLNDEGFKHISYHTTDVRKTFARYRARLKAIAEAEAKEKAEKEQRKTQLKQLRAERLADDKARLKARKG